MRHSGRRRRVATCRRQAAWAGEGSYSPFTPPARLARITKGENIVAPISIKDAIAELQQTRAEVTDRAIDIGKRGYEPFDFNSLPDERKAKIEYMNLCAPCFRFVGALTESGIISLLGDHAELIPSPPGAKFPYKIPMIPRPGDTQPDDYSQSGEWLIAREIGESEPVSSVRLLLWLAVSHDPKWFGYEWSFSQDLLHFLPIEKEHSGRIHPVRRIQRWVWTAAEALVRASKIERSTEDLTMLTDDGTGNVRYSTDFRSVRWFRETYSFTASQAPVVELLYKNWKAGTPDVGDETLLSAVDPEAPPARLSTLFRKHPAWGNMIVAGGSKGSRRLAEPSSEKS